MPIAAITTPTMMTAQPYPLADVATSGAFTNVAKSKTSRPIAAMPTPTAVVIAQGARFAVFSLMP